MTPGFDPDSVANRLSPAGRAALNELVETYRLRLLESVHQASPEGDITVSDLLHHSVRNRHSDIEFDRRYAAEDVYRFRRDQRVLWAAALVSLALGMFVVMIGFAGYLGWDLDQVSGPVAAGIGAAGVITSYGTVLIAITNRMRLRRRLRDLEYRSAVNYRFYPPSETDDDTADPKWQAFARAGLFMAGWREVEAALYRLGRDRLGTDLSSHMALSSIVLALTKEGALSENSAQEARWAVDLRNRLAHGDGTETVSERDIDRLARLAEALRAAAEHTS